MADDQRGFDDIFIVKDSMNQPTGHYTLIQTRTTYANASWGPVPHLVTRYIYDVVEDESADSGATINVVKLIYTLYCNYF